MSTVAPIIPTIAPGICRVLRRAASCADVVGLHHTPVNLRTAATIAEDMQVALGQVLDEAAQGGAITIATLDLARSALTAAESMR